VSYVSQESISLVECDKKSDGCSIHVDQKWIVEIYLKEGGMCVSAFKVRFPKQKGKSGNTQSHNDHLKKYS
jgi:hypothetical protein